MDNAFMKKVVIVRHEIEPRDVQKLARNGVSCAVFTAADKDPGFCIFEDVDGTKLLSFIPANAAEANAETVRKALETLPQQMPDLPLYKITGIPEPMGISPENGVYEVLYSPETDATNIGLNTVHITKDGVVLEFCENEGKETDAGVYCEALDFSFHALFSPWEIKRFVVSADGSVREINFTDGTETE